MISDLEVEVQELRVSVDLLTASIGNLTKTILQGVEVSIDPNQHDLPLEPEAESPTPVTLEEARVIFTKVAASGKREELVTLLGDHNATKLDQLDATQLTEIVSKAEALTA
jgi:hypothetical protein